MQRPLEITLRNVSGSEALEAHIREKAAQLEKYHPRITGCHVVVELPHRHKHQGQRFDLRLDIKVPGEEIVVNREQSEDIYVALRDAFDAARRKLEDHARRLRGDVKTHADVWHGRIVRLRQDEGYGFIESEAGDELYFSEDNVVAPAFAQLQVGDEVHFIQDPSGQSLQAKRVSRGRHQRG